MNNLKPEHIDSAADWFARLRDDDVNEDTKQDFQNWLDINADHRKAWDYMQAAGKRFALLTNTDESDAAASILKERQSLRGSRRNILTGIAIAIGSVLSGGMAYRYTPVKILATAWRSDHSTIIGEVRELTKLAGYHAWLNTATAINTTSNGSESIIELLQGEILLNTDLTVSRPAAVSTTHGIMSPLGTLFDVRTKESSTLLVVFEGEVVLTTAHSNERRHVLAGQQVRFDKNSIGKIQQADPARKAWSRGILLANDITLSALVDELNRYHVGYLRVDPEAADLRVLGGYPLSDPDKTLQMLSEILPIKVHQPVPWWTVIQRI